MKSEGARGRQTRESFSRARVSHALYFSNACHVGQEKNCPSHAKEWKTENIRGKFGPRTVDQGLWTSYGLWNVDKPAIQRREEKGEQTTSPGD